MSTSRNAVNVTRSIAISTAITDAIDMRPFASGSVKVPSAWTTANIGFKVSDTVDGTYDPLYDHTGSIVECATPAASRQIELPPEIFGCAFIKLWSQDGAASDTNQAAARSLIVTLKS